MPDTPARTAHARLTAAGWRYVAGWLPPSRKRLAQQVEAAVYAYEPFAEHVINTAPPRGRPKKPLDNPG